MENEYLAHHGVKGMKWGVRRTPEQLGHPRAKGRSEAVRLTNGTIGYKHNLTYTSNGKTTNTESVGFTKRQAKTEARRAMLEQVGSDKNASTRLMRAQVKASDARDHHEMIRQGKRREKALNAKDAKHLYKYADTLSDAELNQRLARVNSMTQIKNLKRQDVSAGRKIATQVLTNVATQTATNALTKELSPWVNLGAETVVKGVMGKGASTYYSQAKPKLRAAAHDAKAVAKYLANKEAIMSENLYLAHHGVKGMKWGVRRTLEQLGHRRAVRNKRLIDAKASTYEAYAKNNRYAANAKLNIGRDLKDRGSASKWKGFLGDYMDAYDDPKAVDKTLREV